MQHGRYVMFALTLALHVPADHLLAQTRTVAENEIVRLRLVVEDSVLQGLVTTIRPSEWDLRLPDGKSQVITTSSILSAEVLTRHRRTGRGAVIGGIVGAGVGAFLWLLVTDDDACDDGNTEVCDIFFDPVFDHVGKWLAIYSTGGGILLGAVIGSQVRSNRWVPAEIPGSTSGRLELGLSLRLQPPGGR
jgi:hypothetical protein